MMIMISSKNKEDQSSDSDLNVFETSFESFNEDEDFNRKRSKRS